MRIPHVLPVIVIVAIGTAVAHGQCENKQFAKLIASDGVTGDDYGEGIAMDGPWLAVGAYDHAQHGAVYLYEDVSGTWVPRQTLSAPLTGSLAEQLGEHLAMEGNVLAAHANGAVGPGAAKAGLVYVFERTGSTWGLTGTLISTDYAANDGFGRDLAISNGRILVSAHPKDASAGAAYVFEKIAGTWQQTAKLLPNDPKSGASFGYSLDLDGDRAVVGAIGADGSFISDGAAYVFELEQGTWQQKAKLVPGELAGGFGNPVSISGDTVAVANGDHVYFFDQVGPFWIKSATVYAAGGTTGFSSSDLEGDRLVVGARNNDEQGSSAGAMVVFERTDGFWEDRMKAFPNDPVLSGQFGFAVSLDGDRVAIGAGGAPGIAPNTGAAYVFSSVPNPHPTYGVGCAGSGNIVPTLDLPLTYDGCFNLGDDVEFSISNALGGSFAVLFLGLAPAEIPVAGSCNLLVSPPLVPVTIPLLGSGPGNGSITFGATIPQNVGLGAVRAQAFVADSGAEFGFSVTNGVRVSIN